MSVYAGVQLENLKYASRKLQFIGVFDVSEANRIFEPRRMARRYMIAQGTAALAAEPWVRNKRYSNPAEWRGGIMRGVNIYDDNKYLATSSNPLCHPTIRWGSFLLSL